MPSPPSKTYRIGAVGAGFIMRDIQLVAYRNAGFDVAAITSTPTADARKAADLRGIPRVCSSLDEMLTDTGIEIIDIAVPPHAQLEIVRQVAAYKHIRGILAQKPLAINYDQAVETVRVCDQAGVRLAVNQNMRYDQSIRACKSLLKAGELGEPVLATIDMRAIPHWMAWQQRLGWVTLRIMSIHHLDTFRFWFGNPQRVFASVTSDPRTAREFAHEDGICLYILEYASGLRAAAWDDVWTGPAREGAAADIGIRWRLEGTQGAARGTIGWPEYPSRASSTLDFTTIRRGPRWIEPRWSDVWFPDAFLGPMAELLCALEDGRETELSGRDNLQTMALVDACYRSVREHRAVELSEILQPD